MPISSQEVTVADCDGCHSRSYLSLEEYPPGVFAHVQVHESWGGISFDMYSCLATPDHVAKAFTNAMQRELDNERNIDPNSSMPTSSYQIPMFAGSNKNEKKTVGNANPKTDDELLEELRGWFRELGGLPSKDRAKKLLHIGDRRVNLIFTKFFTTNPLSTEEEVKE